MMNQKFEKLQAALKKQVNELGFLDIEDFNIQVERGLLEKFKMIQLHKLDGIRNQKAHLRSYFIWNVTTELKNDQVT